MYKCTKNPQKLPPFRVFRIFFLLFIAPTSVMYETRKTFTFFHKQKVLKFQHFKGLSKFLHFYVCISKHTFLRILRPPYTKLPLKKSLFRVFIHSNTPGGYSPQGQTRHAPLQAVRSATPSARHAICELYMRAFLRAPRRPTGSIESAVRGARRCSKGSRTASCRKAAHSSCCPASTDCRRNVRCAAGIGSLRPASG